MLENQNWLARLSSWVSNSARRCSGARVISKTSGQRSYSFAIIFSADSAPGGLSRTERSVRTDCPRNRAQRRARCSRSPRLPCVGGLLGIRGFILLPHFQNELFVPRKWRVWKLFRKPLFNCFEQLRRLNIV